MSTVINTNIAATRTHNVYNRNNDYMNQALSRVATGMKINSAKDGASTWAISEKMRERIRANDQANQNVQNDTALLKTAQGGIGNTIDILKTLKERAVNAANDSNMNQDRDRIAVEVEQLLTQINDNASKVKFNGRTLLDGTGGTDNTGGASAAKAATMPSTTGNSAVLSLTSLGSASTDKLTSLGFSDGDVITFSWVEDGASSAQTKAFTVDENTTVGNLAFTQSKMKVSYETNGTALKDQNNVNVTGTAGASASADGLWAVGDKSVKITDFKVSVANSEGGTNAAAQSSMVFTGVQQSEGVVASHTVLTLSGLTGTSGAALSTSTVLTALEQGGAGLGITAGDNLYINWKEDGAAASELTFNVADNTKTIGNLTASVTGNVKMGLGDGTTALTSADSTPAAVKDSSGTAVTPASGDLYVVGKEGVKITDFTISKASGGANPILTFTASQTAGDPAPATNTNNNNNGGGGTSTSLTFHIGGEKSLSMTADISSMKVENLFTGYTVGTFKNLFTTKEGAKTAMDAIDEALNTALNEQTKLGAYESRLGYTSDNLVTMNENLEAADSVMRDSDIAKEMTQYMKYSVLAQASQYMLAQAGQNAFSVLNLLQA